MIADLPESHTLAPGSSGTSASENSTGKMEERIVEMDAVGTDFVSQTEFDIELEYSHSHFSVEGDVCVHVADPVGAPIKLGYRDELGTLEVIGWGLEIPLGESSDLPRRIGRRFLELYSKAVTGCLHVEEREWLKHISAQMDYHSFAAARKLPRYREATLIRKTPVLLLQFIEEKNVRLNGALAAKLQVVNQGDRFGAWFTLGEDGEIVDFQHVLLLSPDEMLLEEIPDSEAPSAVQEHLSHLFPNSRK